MAGPADSSPSGATHVLATGDLALQDRPGAPPPLPAPPAAADDPLVGRTLDGRYRVGERLGAGGVGVVYAAEHVEIKKAVALKVLHAALDGSASLRLRFEREARAASRLSHAACVSVIDFGRIATIAPAEGAADLVGTSYLVMERVRGEVLADRVAAGPLPPREAVEIVRGVLAGLRHAHGLGLVHRDVKPANIMLSSDRERGVKLLDFGLAKSNAPDGEPKTEPQTDDDRPLTEAGMVFGTPGYLSPEQAAGQPADARSDLYSLGVVLFELCCGRPPFVHTERMQVVRDHLHTPPPAPRSLAPAISPELEAVILRALAKRPEARYADADALADALAACPEGRPEPAAAPAPSARVAAPRRLLARWRAAAPWQRVLAGALGAGIVLGVVLFALRPPPLAVVVTPPAPAPSGARHLQLAVDYQKRLWCSDAIEELERAARVEPRLGGDPTAISVAVGCLRNKTQQKAVRFLVDFSGRAALPALAEVEAGDPRPDRRAGAGRARQEILSKK